MQARASTAAGVAGEILIVDSSERPHRGARARPAAPACCRRRKRGLGRAYIDALPYVRGQCDRHGRRRLHLRLPPAGSVRRRASARATSSSWARAGRARSRPARCPRLHRYLGTPVTTWILNRLYSQPLLRHPLRHARHHARRARAHGSAVAVVGVRVRDDARSRCTWSCAPTEVPVTFLKDREGRLEPPQARRLVLAVAGGVDQPARDVRLRLGLLPASSPASCSWSSACCSRCPLSFGDLAARTGHALAQLAVPRGRAARGRASRRSCSAASPRSCSTTRAATGSAGCRVFPYTRTVLSRSASCCSASRSPSHSSSTYITNDLRARAAPTRSRTTSPSPASPLRSPARSSSCSRCCSTARSSPRRGAGPRRPKQE